MRLLEQYASHRAIAFVPWEVGDKDRETVTQSRLKRSANGYYLHRIFQFWRQQFSCSFIQACIEIVTSPALVLPLVERLHILAGVLLSKSSRDTLLLYFAANCRQFSQSARAWRNRFSLHIFGASLAECTSWPPISLLFEQT